MRRVTCRAEYFKILRSVGVGFVIMGFVGFVVKVSPSPCLSRSHPALDMLLRALSAV